MDKSPCVYMLATGRNGTLYIGVNMLVWCEPHETMESAIVREKRMKKWNRAWKIRQIMRGNREWRDLTEDIC